MYLFMSMLVLRHIMHAQVRQPHLSQALDHPLHTYAPAVVAAVSAALPFP